MGVSNNYINEVKEILKNARQKAYTAVNSAYGGSILEN